MKEPSEADLHVKTYSLAAESYEQVKRDTEKNAEMEQRQKEESIANIYKMMGQVTAMNFSRAQADFFNLVILKKVKDSREYLRIGMTWAQFCEKAGINIRTVDRYLEKLDPFRQDFLDTLSNFTGVTFNKIKFLGISVKTGISQLSEKDITYNGETIPFDAEHQDEIKALLETIEEDHRKKIEEKDATIRTKDRLIQAKDDMVNRMEKELMRLEKRTEKSDLTDKEQEAVNLLHRVQLDFLGGMNDIDKLIKPHEAPDIALRMLYFLYIFISKVAMDKRFALHESYRDAEDVPWEITEEEIPEADILIDNLPASAGMGKKYREKIDQRTAKAKKKSGQGENPLEADTNQMKKTAAA